MESGSSYEFLCFSVFLASVFLISHLWKRRKTETRKFLSILLVGLFFGVGWEPHGTELVWRYPGYRFYAFMGIPLALLLSWSWWMVICRLIADRIDWSLKKVKSNDFWLTPIISFYLSGILVALIVEPLSVALGWWEYLVIGERAILNFPFFDVSFNLTVIVGWGMLTTLNLTLADRARPLASSIESGLGLGSSGSLFISCALMGLFNGWFSWQIVSLFAAIVEGEAPRIFFTRYHIFKLEALTGVELLGVLMATLFIGYYLWRLSNERANLIS